MSMPQSSSKPSPPQRKVAANVRPRRPSLAHRAALTWASPQLASSNGTRNNHIWGSSV
jgi:hypothetical protein